MKKIFLLSDNNQVAFTALMYISTLRLILITLLFFFASAPVKASFEDPVDQRSNEYEQGGDINSRSYSLAETQSEQVSRSVNVTQDDDSNDDISSDLEQAVGGNGAGTIRSDSKANKIQYLQNQRQKLEWFRTKFYSNLEQNKSIIQRIEDAQALNQLAQEALNSNEVASSQQNTPATLLGYFTIDSTAAQYSQRANLLEGIITCYYNRTYFLPNAYNGLEKLQGKDPLTKLEELKEDEEALIDSKEGNEESQPRNNGNGFKVNEYRHPDGIPTQEEVKEELTGIIKNITSLFNKDTWAPGDYENMMRQFYAEGSKLRRIKALLELKRDDNEQDRSKKLTSYQRQLKQDLADYYKREIDSIYSGGQNYEGEYTDHKTSYIPQVLETRVRVYNWIPYDPFSIDVPTDVRQQDGIDRTRSANWRAFNRSIGLLRNADFFASNKDHKLSVLISKCYYNAARRNLLAINKTADVLKLEKRIKRGAEVYSNYGSSSSFSSSSGKSIVRYTEQETNDMNHQYSYQIAELNATQKDATDFESLATKVKEYKIPKLNESRRNGIDGLTDDFKKLLQHIADREDRYPPLPNVVVRGVNEDNNSSSRAQASFSNPNERTPLTTSDQLRRSCQIRSSYPLQSNNDQGSRRSGLLTQIIRGVASLFRCIFRIFC